MTTTSRDVAEFIGADHVGESVRLTGIGSLDGARRDELAFCVYDDPEYVRKTTAGAVVCAPGVGRVPGSTQIVTDEPRAGFARAASEFFAEKPTETTIHPTAVVHPDATVGERTRIGPHVHVGEHVTIGDDCTIRSGTALGCDGFGFARDASGRLHRMHHQGSVRIEDGVEIGPNSSVDRAVFDETVVGGNAKLSGQVHVAHQVRIGRETTIAYGAGIAGGAVVGDRVTVHPHVSIANDVTVGDDAELGMNAGVLSDVPSGTTVVGTPARPVERSDAIVGSAASTHGNGGAD